MMIINIKNKTDFISKFLLPISRINNACSIKLTSDKMVSLVTTQDASVILNSEIQIECDVTEEVNLNLPDITKLVRVLECIQEEEIELKLNNNSISYNKSGVKFKYHLLEDGIISIPRINFEKVISLDYDTKFSISNASFQHLIKSSSFACDTNKMYLRTDEEKVYGELTDKNKSNVDSIEIILSENFEGKDIQKALPLNFEVMRIVSTNRYDNVKIWINIDLSVMVFIIVSDNVKMHYVASGLAET